jgi:hypothetical protein
MALITSISVVALASMAAILINDHTRFGGALEDSDDNFSVFSRPAASAAVPVRMDEQNESAQMSSTQVKEVARV